MRTYCTDWCLVHPKYLVHILINRQQKRVAFCQLIPELALSCDNRSLILVQLLFQFRNTGLGSNEVMFCLLRCLPQ